MNKDWVGNDETKNIARPFIVLAGLRTGGTFCTHALSNHPQIFCDRGEVMHGHSIWCVHAGLEPGALCRFLWNQTGYHASGFRLVYWQALKKAVRLTIKQVQPHVIHLQRRSLIRQALSAAYTRMVRAGEADYHPVHSFKERKPPAQRLPTSLALNYVQRLIKEHKQGRQQFMGYPGQLIDVYFENMIGHTPGSATRMAPEVAKQICEFLGVRPLPLPVDLRRDHPVPTTAMFSNWPAIEKALRREGFGEAVDYELERQGEG